MPLKEAAMQITIEIPQQLPDIMHCSPGDFEKQAKMAMVAKLYEMGKLSSGIVTHEVQQEILTGGQHAPGVADLWLGKDVKQFLHDNQ